ncbi:MAG: phosphoethanolamine--lipid A transferase, partial [Sulfurimonas sp.]|nr:phosphoethanolamine--lipid A transferase [Sulfurimonas sp.]
VEYKTYKMEILSKSAVIVSSLLLVALSYMLLGKYYSAFFRNHGELRYYLNPSYPVYSFAKYVKKEFAKPQEIIPIARDAKIVESGVKKRLFVFVVGETARAHNFSLNGYEHDTNPLLEVQGNIVNLENFYSCGTATAVSLPCMFSKFSKSEYSEEKKSYENLVDVIGKVGIRVLWRDNNSGKSKGVADRIKDVKYFGGEKFDEVMLEDLQQSIDASYEDTLIVLHQEGSHGPTYYKRYPEEFKKFKPTCDTQDLEKCTQEEIVNTYDNTILYTDYLLDKTIKFLQNNEQKYETFMMYVSDHGESLGENGIYLHGLPYAIAPDFQKHVPAVFYFGNDMKEKREILETLKTDEYSHDYIFHTFLGLFGVETKEYDKNLDIFKNLS